MKSDVFNIESLKIRTAVNPDSKGIAYILYPMDTLQDWLVAAAQKHSVSIVCITNMDWDNDLTPWPAPGVPKGSPDFKGNSSEFLQTLTDNIIPAIERHYALSGDIERTLIGVSLSGLFTLWQWPMCDVFYNIATLSGSYWYEGFEQWVLHQSFSEKKGKCYMLLGEDEPHSNIPIFRKVGVCTDDIVGYLRREGVDITFDTVPGNHFQYGIERLNKAFENLFLVRYKKSPL